MSTKSATDLPGEDPQSFKRIIIPLITLILGCFMVLLDGSAVNVALPKLSGAFGASLSSLQWVITAYVLATAAVIPLAGWLSDKFGAKRIFLYSIAFFTLGSILCAMAADSAMLILFRIIQGAGGGMVMPIAFAFVYKLSPPDKVGAIMGILGIPVLLAPALGPIIAGWLVDYASWQWIFIINIPVGLLAIGIGLRFLPDIPREPVTDFDLWGIVLAPIAFAGLSYGVSEGANGWTSFNTVTGLSIGIIALVLFILVELRHKQPILELRVFKSMDFTKGIVIQWIFQIALFGSMFLVPVFLQQAQNYSAFDTGIIMLPQAIAAAVIISISGTLFDKVGARPLVIAGMTFVAVSAFILTRVTAADGVSVLILPLALLGAGMGLSLMPLNTHLIQASPPKLVGRVTSLTNAAQQVMSSFAIAGLMTVLTRTMKGFMPGDGIPTLDTWTKAFSGTFMVLVYIASIGLILGFLLKKPAALEEGDSAAHLETGKSFM
ncbi:MDR family MFS transporter [Paenibacillus sp. FSL R7-0297]|uniref:MDR family MFS transporter n=1 Tax=unclassified Paenibacillus TaxID=185978 RepID=UPI0030F8D21F